MPHTTHDLPLATLQDHFALFPNATRTNDGYALWTHVMDSVFEATLCADQHGRLIYCSSKARTMFRWPKNGPLGEFFWKALELPAQSLEQALAACDDNGMLRLSKANNSRGEFLLRLVAMPQAASDHAYTLLLMDLDRLGDSWPQYQYPRRQSHALDDALGKALLRSLRDDDKQGMLLVDCHGFILAGNVAFRNIFAVENELEGEHLDALLPLDKCPCLKKLSSLNGQRLECCVDLELGGTARSIEIQASKLDMEEGRFLYKLRFEDVSECKALREGLSRKREEVEEMRITLRNVLRYATLDGEGHDNDQNHIINVEVLPATPGVSEKSPEEAHGNQHGGIRKQLNELADGEKASTNPLLYDLTPTEFKVCEQIRDGHATKEIAENMHLAFETVQTHRKNIRRKLGLKGRKISLYMFLRSGGRAA